MSAIDFESWVAPNLEITLGGRTFSVRPPSVDDAKLILAAAVRGEIELGLVKGEVPPEVDRLLTTIPTGRHPALGAAFDEMASAGIPQRTIDRVAYYAVFYWARSREYADMLATILWAPRDLPGAGAASAPKARRRSPRKSGRSTA